MTTDYEPAPDELRDFYINESTSFPGPDLADSRDGGANSEDSEIVTESKLTLESANTFNDGGESFSQWLDERQVDGSGSGCVLFPTLSEFPPDQPNGIIGLPAEEQYEIPNND